jgi:tetratricopeptide (TPR) repeat protein
MHLARYKSDNGEVEAASRLAASADSWLSKSPESAAEAFDRVWTMGAISVRAGLHAAAAQLLVQRDALRRAMNQEKHPFAAWDYFVRARNLSMAGRYDEADDILARAPHFDPYRDGRTHLDIFNQLIVNARAGVALDRGEPQMALALLPDSAEGDLNEGVYPTSVQVMRGVALCETGRPHSGLQLLQTQDIRYAHTQHPTSPTLAYVRSQAGLCALKFDEKRLATKLARQAREAFVAQPKVSPYYKAPLKRLEEGLGLHLPPV